FILADQTAPGVVYTAGVTSSTGADPGFSLQSVADPINPGATITVPIASDPSGFFAPQVLTCDPGYFCNPYGVMTAAAFPVDGGNITIAAQQDILGFENPVVSTLFGDYPNQQYFAPWLLAQGSSLANAGFGP